MGLAVGLNLAEHRRTILLEEYDRRLTKHGRKIWKTGTSTAETSHSRYFPASRKFAAIAGPRIQAIRI